MDNNLIYLAVDGRIYNRNFYTKDTGVVGTADVYDDLRQKFLEEINTEVLDTLEDLSAENTQIEGSIAALSELKQNKLTAGSNITINGNVISAITGGDRGETPIVLYKWSATTPLAPTISVEDYIGGENLDGWTTIATSKTAGTNLWMTQNTLIYLEGDYSLKDNWSTPILISGDKGDPGDPGKDGSDREFIYKRLDTYPFDGTNPALITRDSENIERTAEYIAATDDFVPYGWEDNALPATASGKYVYVSERTKASGNNLSWGAFTDPVLWSNWGEPGEDASDREFIYKRLTEHPFNGTNPASITTDNKDIERTVEYIANTDDFIPLGWTDKALPATEAEKYVYVSIRIKPAGNNQTWGTFSKPILWSNWGHQGIDGDGVQYVYKLFDHLLTADEKSNLRPAKPDSMTNGEWIPNGWSDDPLAPTPTNKYCYCSVIRKINGEWQLTFGELGLWSKWASDGSSVMARYSKSGAADTWHSPFEVGDIWMLTSSDNGRHWTAPMRIVGEKGDETDFQFAISRFLTAPGEPEDTSGLWSNTPVTTTSNLPYLWAKITVPDGTISYVRLTGELGSPGKAGESAIFADLTNEMDSIACNSEGYTTSELFIETNVGIYKGSKEQTLSGIECKIANITLGTEYSNDPSTVAYYYKATTDLTTGYVKVTVKENTFIDSRTDVLVTLSSTIDRVPVVRSLTLTINGVRGGANGSPAIIYSLVPSTTKIVKKKNGSFIPNDDITCSVVKREGTSSPQTVTSGFTLTQKVNGGDESAYSSVASSTITSSIEYFLYVNGVLVDTETIPLVEDGTDGVSNVWTIGEDGYWYLNGNKTNHLAEGPAGTGILLEGTVDYIFNSELPNPNTDNKTSLEGLSSLTVGDCYLVCDNGWLYFYDGETPENTTNTILNNGKPANPLGWRPVGEIKGRPGDSGITYYYHIAWATSITYDSVSGKLSSCTGFITDKGNVDYPWMGICVDTVYDDPGSPNRIILDESDNDISYKSYAWNNVEGAQGPPGENADTPAFLYRWILEGGTVDTPTVEVSNYVKDNISGNWLKIAPNRSADGYNLWMSQRTLLKAINGTYSWKEGSWSTPVRISGDTGTPGEDGDTREWIYSYSNTGYNGLYGYVGEYVDQDHLTDNKNQSDWVPEGWTDNPQGVFNDNARRTEYASYRDITHSGTTVSYGDFHEPIIWAHYGEAGIDGDGIEYVFVRTKKQIAPTVCDRTGYNGGDWTQDEYRPYVEVTSLDDENPINGGDSIVTNIDKAYIVQCTDNPQGVDSEWKFEWTLTRKKASVVNSNLKRWSQYVGTMSLWSNWGEKGEKGDPGKSISSVKEYYIASKKSSGVKRDGNTLWNESSDVWRESVPLLDPTYKYLWNYEEISYLDSDGTISKTPTDPALIGVYGNDGRSILQVVEYYLATSESSGITRDHNTYNWTTEVLFVDPTNKYLWNYEEIRYSSGNPSYEETDPVIIGTYGEPGPPGGNIKIQATHIYYKVAENTNTPDPDSGWDENLSNVLPQINSSTPYLWTKTVIIYVDADGNTTPVTSYTVSRSGFNGSSIKVQYSEVDSNNNNDWHEIFGTNDVWMRISTNDGESYGDPVRIVGERGNQGNYIEYSFNISAYSTTSGIGTAPTDIEKDEKLNPIWHDAPIATTSAKPYLWMLMILHTITDGGDLAGQAHYLRITSSNEVLYIIDIKDSSSQQDITSFEPSLSNINAVITLKSQVAGQDPVLTYKFLVFYRKLTDGTIRVTGPSVQILPTLKVKYYTVNGYSDTRIDHIELVNYSIPSNVVAIGVIAAETIIGNAVLAKLNNGNYLTKLEIPVKTKLITEEDLAEAQTIVIGLGGEGYGKIELNDLGQVVIDASLLVVRAPGGTIDGKQIITADHTTGKIDSLYLPSSLDDVIELVAISSTNPPSCQINTNYYNTVDKCIYYAYRPTGGNPLWSRGESPEKGKIYVDVSTNTIYRWSGSILVEISSGNGGGGGSGNATSVGGYKIQVLYPGQWHPETAASDTIYYILEPSDNMVEIPEDIELDYLIGWEGYTPVTQQGWEFVVEPLACVNVGTYYYEIALTGLDAMWNDGTVENHYLMIVVNPQVITSPASTKRLLYTGQTHNISELYTPPYGLSMSYNVENPANADLRDVGTYTVRLNTNNNNVVFENNQSYIDIEVTIDEITTWTFGDVFPIILNSN